MSRSEHSAGPEDGVGHGRAVSGARGEHHGGRGLRIEIHDEHARAPARRGNAHREGDRRLSHSSLLVHDRVAAELPAPRAAEGQSGARLASAGRADAVARAGSVTGGPGQPALARTTRRPASTEQQQGGRGGRRHQGDQPQVGAGAGGGSRDGAWAVGADSPTVRRGLRTLAGCAAAPVETGTLAAARWAAERADRGRPSAPRPPRRRRRGSRRPPAPRRVRG